MNSCWFFFKSSIVFVIYLFDIFVSGGAVSFQWFLVLGSRSYFDISTVTNSWSCGCGLSIITDLGGDRLDKTNLAFFEVVD